MDYSAASMDQLKTEFRRLAAVVSDATQQRHLIWLEMSKRRKLAAAKARLASMTNEEIDALRAELEAMQ